MEARSHGKFIDFVHAHVCSRALVPSTLDFPRTPHIPSQPSDQTSQHVTRQDKTPPEEVLYLSSPSSFSRKSKRRIWETDRLLQRGKTRQGYDGNIDPVPVITKQKSVLFYTCTWVHTILSVLSGLMGRGIYVRTALRGTLSFAFQFPTVVHLWTLFPLLLLLPPLSLYSPFSPPWELRAGGGRIISHPLNNAFSTNNTFHAYFPPLNIKKCCKTQNPLQKQNLINTKHDNNIPAPRYKQS